MKPARACCSALQHHLWGARPRLAARLSSELRVARGARGHGHALAARAPGLLTPAARLSSELRMGELRGARSHALAARAPGLLTPAVVSKSSGKRETGLYYSDRGNCIRKPFGPPVGLRYDQAPRHSLSGPISATSGDAKANTIKTDDRKRDLYISFAVFLAIKMYYTLQDKLPGLVDTKSLMSEKYVSLAATMFSLIKALYKALKLAKEIQELIKYYRLKKKGQAN